METRATCQDMTTNVGLCYCNIGKKLDLYASKVEEMSVSVFVSFHKINS